MSDVPAPAAAPSAGAPARPRASQDSALANRINQYRTALTLAQSTPELSELLAARGYAAAALTAGLDLCAAAESAFGLRQQAMADQTQAAAAARAADRSARSGYDDFRKIARAVFKTDPAARQSLGIDARAPGDRETFQSVAGAAYTRALASTSTLAALAPHGFTQAALEAERVKLAALTTAGAAHDAAQAAATRATADRDAAAKALSDWWGKFRAVAKVALKARPELLGQLGL